METSALRVSMSRGTRCLTTSVSHTTLFSFMVSHTDDNQLAEAALAYFNRTLYHYDIATGEKKVTADLETSGQPNATHTNSFVPLTSSYVPAFPSPIYPATTSAY